MKFGLLVCGKLKPSPETDLVQDYLNRAKKQGRSLGITDVPCKQVSLRAGASAQMIGKLAIDAIPAGAKRVILDETGKNLTSKQLCSQINSWRELSVSDVLLMVGPADGWPAEALSQADLVLSFGKMTWPHKLAQVMAAEQIYRVISIMSGSAYHREGK